MPGSGGGPAGPGPGGYLAAPGSGRDLAALGSGGELAGPGSGGDPVLPGAGADPAAGGGGQVRRGGCEGGRALGWGRRSRYARGGAPGSQGGVGRDDYLVRVHDLAGRLRGVGFVADHHGTVVTGHEVVDGLARIVLHAGDRSCVVSADAVTPLPGRDLALVRTEGLGVDPLPLSVRDTVEPGTYVRLPAGCWREARVLGPVTVTYTATDRFHLLDGVLELAIGTAGRDALRLGGGAAGGPVLDAETGAVVAVLGTALQSGPRDTAHAIPLRSPGNGVAADVRARKAVTGQIEGNTGTGPLADARTETAAPGPLPEHPVTDRHAENDPTDPLAALLAENAATVPAYGADLNLMRRAGAGRHLSGPGRAARCPGRSCRAGGHRGAGTTSHDRAGVRRIHRRRRHRARARRAAR